MVFHGAKIIVDGTTVEQVSNVEYLGSNVSSYITNIHLMKNLHKFNHMMYGRPAFENSKINE